MNTLFIFLVFLHTLLISCNAVPMLKLHPHSKPDLDIMGKRAFGRKAGELSGDEEMMDTEFSRRALMAGKSFVSHGSLQKDVVPCNTLGASYYNCKKPGNGSLNAKGCDAITRCSRDSVGS
ncbi:Rapid alkalinization factor [Heracleum sosnowskyi]|uniref:Rapid alkalinization factor n=1 Tax=Heracleum sosnowskyi TaxID=360622 RepID=A0AAD8I9U4_9APIA|nr:Rapid alkalinization factor [Heracleum sosnowskyi]